MRISSLGRLIAERNRDIRHLQGWMEIKFSLPAANSSEPMEQAWPLQRVETGDWMYYLWLGKLKVIP